jgi:phasin family protein
MLPIEKNKRVFTRCKYHILTTDNLYPPKTEEVGMAIAFETLLNHAKFTEELTSKLKDYRLPSIEVDAVVASQRENVEALANASRAAFEGAQAVAKRQAEILQETMSQTAESFRTLAEAGSPPEVAAKQAELAKEAFEKALGNMRELAEMVTKAQQGAMDTISGRISQSLDEIKDMALKMKEPHATEEQLSAKEKQPSAKQKQPSAEAGTPKA